MKTRWQYGTGSSSATRVLTDLLLQREGIAPAQLSGHGDTELTHAAVAAYVASGMADVGIGVETAARRFGLHIIPLLKERYFFALTAQGVEDGRPCRGMRRAGRAGCWRWRRRSGPEACPKMPLPALTRPA